MKKIIFIQIFILCLLFVFPEEEVNLIGYWEFSYKIGKEEFTDCILVKKILKNGRVEGVNKYAIPVHGWKMGKIVFISEKYISKTYHFYMDGWLYKPVEGTKGKHLGVFILA